MKNAAHISWWRTSDFIMLATLAIASLLEYLFPTQLPVSEELLLFGGIASLLIAWAILIKAKLDFKKYSQPSKPRRPTTQLVTSGIFLHTRNPMYVGVVIIVIGLGFILNSFWVIASSFIVAILLQFLLILPEEKYLKDNFGKEYDMYFRQTNRWY